MTRILKDPLLDIARIILVLLMGIFILAGGACIVAMAVGALNYGEIVANVAGAGAGPGVFWALLALLLVLSGLFAMAFLFARHLMRIVDSVGKGDPFVPENADRLTSMAWLMLAIQLVAIPVIATAFWIGSQFNEGHTVGELNFDGNGLILVLTLFILARVFRKGTEMREDLEGTV